MLKFRKILKKLWKLFLWFNIISIFLVLLFRFVPVPYTITMLSRNFQNGSTISKDWVSYEDVSPYVPLAIVASEDQKFPNHWGFDWDGIIAAYEANNNGKVQSGGSTITQQTAKNVFLWQHKSYFRKGLEAYYTGLIELLWPKKRILEVYMNVAETGINTFGVEAGARKYFNKSAKDLNKEEAARLVQTLPSPQRYSAQTNLRTRKIMRQMNNLGLDYVKKIE